MSPFDYLPVVCHCVSCLSMLSSVCLIACLLYVLYFVRNPLDVASVFCMAFHTLLKFLFVFTVAPYTVEKAQQSVGLSVDNLTL